MKTCSTCKEQYPFSEFYAHKKHKDGLSYVCKTCAKLRCKEWRLENVGVLRVHAKKIRDQTRRVLAYIRGHARCEDCGAKFSPEVMQFDHRIPGLKKYPINDCNTAWGMFIEELEKCDIVCANCHAIRTAKQREAGWSNGVSGAASKNAVSVTPA